jgi:hypothetical protein
MLYSDTPLLREEVQLSAKVQMFAMISRPLMLTEAGHAFLRLPEAASLVIRYPIELMHLPPTTVLDMVCPTKHVISVSTGCTIAGCDKERHTKLHCFMHYQQIRQASAKLLKERSVSTSSFISQDDTSEPKLISSTRASSAVQMQHPVTLTADRLPVSSDIFQPTAQRGVPVVLTPP